MNTSNITKFRKQDTDFHINLFEVKKPLFIKLSIYKSYLKWLYVSTLDLKSKLVLMETSKTHLEIVNAIETLKSNYHYYLIPRRNQQLNAYALSKRNPP